MKNIADHLFTIPSNHSFVDSLASGIIQRFGEEALQQSDMLLLLPNRRSAQALKDAFLRLSDGKPTLLPRMMPLGDMDEEEIALTLLSDGKMLDILPAIAPVRQQLILAKLTHEWRKNRYGEDAMFVHSLKLAGELVRFLSEVEREQLSFDNLEQLYPEEFQEHWQDTLEFLKILMENWPALLREQNAITLAEYRNQMMELQAEIWIENPPGYPVIAAGVTGTFPAATKLLSTIAMLPNGYLVLPGLDQNMQSNAWESMGETHPQYEMKMLLSHLQCDVHEVSTWESGNCNRISSDERLELISQLMRPAEAVDSWRHYHAAKGAFLNISQIETSSLHEEAGVIALMLREALEVEGKTAALVTHDRNLAKHVVVAMKRWDIHVNDSAGKPLAESAPVVFLRLIASLIESNFSIHTLLGCLKHPYAALGYSPITCLNYTREIERKYLRGVCVTRTPAELLARLKAEDEKPALIEFIERASDWFESIAALQHSRERLPILSLLEKILQAAELLATTDKEAGAERLWSSDAAEQFQNWYQQLQHIEDLPQEVFPFEAESLLEALLEGVSFRPRYGLHPRVHILGPLEARLQPYDLMVLGGLNEGSWPSLPSADPWMSRPMRAQFGLPLPERRIGQSAHDFMQYFCAKEVVLTRSRKVDGAETTPSRWWMRLDAVLKASQNQDVLTPNKPWLEWYRKLYKDESLPAIIQPKPKPPLSLRPRTLSATNIEKLQQNPYAVYAKYILKLKQLDEVDKAPGALEFGNFIHKVAEKFTEKMDVENKTSEQLVHQWLELADEVLEAQALPKTIKQIWMPRITRIADEMVQKEIIRKSEIKSLYSEIQGTYEFESSNGKFILFAKADRIEINHENGVHIIDYKTGAAPNKKVIESGIKSQLPLEALIALKGEFTKIREQVEQLHGLSYWQMSGRKKALDITTYPEKKITIDEVQAWVDEAEQGLKQLIEWFDDASHAYIAYPYGSAHLPYDEYKHLIREEEWEQ